MPVKQFRPATALLVASVDGKNTPAPVADPGIEQAAEPAQPVEIAADAPDAGQMQPVEAVVAVETPIATPEPATAATATAQRDTLRTLIRAADEGLAAARAALGALSWTDTTARRAARLDIADREQELRDLRDADLALEPAIREETAAWLHQVHLSRFDQAGDLLRSREVLCAKADRLIAELASTVAQAGALEASARTMTAMWRTVAPSSADCVLGNLVRFGTLDLDLLPLCYRLDIQPLSVVRTLAATAQVLTEAVEDQRPTAPPPVVPTTPVSFETFATMASLDQHDMHSYPAVERVGTNPPPYMPGPAPRVSPIFGLEVDEATIRSPAAA